MSVPGVLPTPFAVEYLAKPDGARRDLTKNYPVGCRWREAEKNGQIFKSERGALNGTNPAAVPAPVLENVYLLRQSFLRFLRGGLCSTRKRVVCIGAWPGNTLARAPYSLSQLATPRLSAILLAITLAALPLAGTTGGAAPVLTPLQTDFVPLGESLQLPQLLPIQFGTVRLLRQSYLVIAPAASLVLPILLGRAARKVMPPCRSSSERALPRLRAPPRG
jgi:hypothetical protein